VFINGRTGDEEDATEVCCGEEEERSEAEPGEEMAVRVAGVGCEQQKKQTQDHREEQGGERDLAESAGLQHCGWSIAFPSVRWFAVRMGVSSEAVARLGYGEGGGGFELHGAGKEDVVLQVGVLAKVVLELLEAGVEDAVAETDAEGRGEVVTELADM
jgi:hypothetical protein